MESAESGCVSRVLIAELSAIAKVEGRARPSQQTEASSSHSLVGADRSAGLVASAPTAAVGDPEDVDSDPPDSLQRLQQIEELIRPQTQPFHECQNLTLALEC